ncbi:putative glycosyltransferase [Rhodovulum sp. P5]|uniref:glycosyltransferase n=1 Tax=Rhodovulum sp. P5 TaxID=1564506 RepID=UPI0009C1C851|nr:glycosyltransferase [Rhodovulum sp. P5]ARE41236.1 putative glycosyltransferase [Rhodovulum sp. P5]
MIFGSGPLEAETRALARDLGLSELEIVTGTTAPEDLYGRLDLLLLMSRVEGVPNTLIEAQACGLPVAACDVGGVGEAMLRRGPAAGLLMAPDIAPGDAADSLAEWLDGALAADPAPRVRFAHKGFGRAALAGAALALYRGKEPGR